MIVGHVGRCRDAINFGVGHRAADIPDIGYVRKITCITRMSGRTHIGIMPVILVKLIMFLFRIGGLRLPRWC
jgi:hypothetical protein